MRELHFKDDAQFQKNLDLGTPAVVIAYLHLELFGHFPEAKDPLAFSNKIFRQYESKGTSTPDLVCPRCDLKVEVRARSEHVCSMTDGHRRHFEDLGLDTYVAFVSPGGIRYVTVRQLADKRAAAEKRHYPGRDPFLIWKNSVIRAETLPKCRT